MNERARRRAGFTLIEVMVSLGVMMVGAMAVIGLQAHAIRGNVHARDLTIATQIAQRWIERLKQDAATWNVPDDDVATIPSHFSNTSYLGQDMSTLWSSPSAFQTLPATWTTQVPVSNAFDARGRDVPANGTQSFCASYRRAWIWEGRLMRVDVRVWWPREVNRTDGSRPQFAADGFAACADAGGLIDPGGQQYDWYHVVYLSTAIRVNEVRR